MKKQPSVIGGACIIASICVGAGMLGLPSAGAGGWTIWSIIAILLTMVIMTTSGGLLLETFKHYHYRVSFNTVTQDLLGSKINFINNLAVYFVGFILLYAYITSSGLIIQSATGINAKIASILFVLIFSAFVWHSTKAVDRISVILILFMVFSFIFSISGLTMNISPSILWDSNNADEHYAIYFMALLPVALTSFGYHHSVASMRIYYREEKKAFYAIVGGTTIATLLYLVWLISIFGNLPRSEFANVIQQGGNVDALLSALNSVIDSSHIKTALNIFSSSAILSSFIGVGLGVFDFIADLFKIEDNPKSRLKTWALTFLPPLILSISFPFGFILAIGYAGAVATIWTCIIPALLAHKVRKVKNETQHGFKIYGGLSIITITIIFGICVAAFHMLSLFGHLPQFSG